MDYYIKGSSCNRQSNESQKGRMYSRRRSPSPVADAIEGVEYTRRSGKPRQLSSSKYDRLRCEGRCFNCKRRGHVSTACLEDEELSKKTAGVARATSSSMKEKKGIRKARKEESSSEELGRISQP
jgi:hypothetical protein